MTASREQIRIAKEKILELVRSSPALSAALASVSIAMLPGGDQAIKVGLARQIENGSELPTDIDGIPVQVEVVGETKAFD